MPSRSRPPLHTPARRAAYGLLALLASLGALAILTTGASARRAAAVSPPAVPQGFVGVNVDDNLMAGPNAPVDYAQQLKTMVASGVQSVRAAFDWSQAQPYASQSDVPSAQAANFTEVGGRPTDFAETDELVGQAALRGISVFPTILYAPQWDARQNPNGINTPKSPGPFAQYAAALVGRYGPRGSYWSSHPSVPKRPIRLWQIWNEPDLTYDWPQPFAKSYVALMKAAHAAIHRADPGAKVVLGALTNFAWQHLASVYRVPGGRGSFDVVSTNGFTLKPGGVLNYLHYVRRAMIQGGDAGKPLIDSEVSWPSAVGKTTQKFDFDTTQAGQARDISQVLPLLGARRQKLGLMAFYWYTWIGDETEKHLAFAYAGLLKLVHGKVSAKPALAAFRTGALALEHCRRKGSVATQCLSPTRG